MNILKNNIMKIMDAEQLTTKNYTMMKNKSVLKNKIIVSNKVLVRNFGEYTKRGVIMFNNALKKKVAGSNLPIDPSKAKVVAGIVAGKTPAAKQTPLHAKPVIAAQGSGENDNTTVLLPCSRTKGPCSRTKGPSPREAIHFDKKTLDGQSVNQYLTKPWFVSSRSTSDLDVLVLDKKNLPGTTETTNEMINKDLKMLEQVVNNKLKENPQLVEIIQGFSAKSGIEPLTKIFEKFGK